jgi:hypothetical protein
MSMVSSSRLDDESIATLQQQRNNNYSSTIFGFPTDITHRQSPSGQSGWMDIEFH